MPKKPTGKIPTLTISISPDNEINHEIKFVKFSLKKEKIEQEIVDLFISITKRYGFYFIKSPKQNEQDDFDFTLNLPRGNIYLELTEFIIKDEKIPYKTFKSIRKCGEIHDMFIKIFDNKVNKAKKRLKKMKALNKKILPIDLLCYITHADYKVDDTVIILLQNTLFNYSHPFENIFLLQAISKDHAEIRVLSSKPSILIDDETKNTLRDSMLVNLF